MANQGHDITYNANELTGQTHKDDVLNQYEEGYQSTQDSSYTAQASSFLQQAIYCLHNFFTGEQVKSVAHGVAEVMKNTLGMNKENTSTKNTSNDPSHLSTRA
ncbi:hypothetical protein Peur_020845 [Populus x canadensis]